MHIGPIFRALMHSKARFWLVTLEIALTMAIVVNCVNVMLDLRAMYVRDTGIDEESIIAVSTEPIGEDFADSDYVDEVRRADLEALRAVPGVVAAAATHQIPLSGSGSSTGRRPLGSEMEDQPTPYFLVSEGFQETLDLDIVAGRGFVPADWNYEEDEDGIAIDRNVLVTENLATALFPEGKAVGQQIQNDEGQIVNTIVGVAREIPNSWPGWEEGRDWCLLFPGKPGSQSRMAYLVRAEPRAVPSVLESLESVMLAANPDRIVGVRTLAEVKREEFTAQLALTKMITAVISLLVLVTSLGIVGLTAFSVAQRTRQIGTRRALGATRGDILRYFLVENWIITGIGLALGVALTFGLNYVLVTFADSPKMPLGLILGGMGLLWGTGILAALAPAWRATRVSPEVATRTV